MSELTRKQARLVEKQISKLYGRNYIPLINGNNTLSIGDILLDKKDIVPILDSSVFDKKNIEFVEGGKLNSNITSNSGVNISTKLKGQDILPQHFNINEAGIVVEFSSEDQMLLKVIGIRQQSIKNFVSFRQELLNKFVSGELSSKVYVVRGLVYADKYYLQYSGNNGGSITFNLTAEAASHDAEVNADFSFKWKKEVGYNIDGSNGGVLAYRVSGVRLKRHLIPENIHENILKGMSEADALNLISYNQKKDLFNNDALEIVDLTEEILLSNDEQLT